jgi:ATP-dependent helicase HepA
VTAAQGRWVNLSFQGGACNRRYTKESAPLRRVAFKAGDRIQTGEGRWLTVEATEHDGELIRYTTRDGAIDEAALSDTMVFTAPFDRLVTGHVDSSADFDLRRRASALRHRLERSPVRGFVGGRIELIPHQLYIAREVSGRHVRRVLLADEVGLGKTIEACLILHRLMAGGRLGRALIAVPESLVHVWFVELLRKFNLLFRIFDRKRLTSFDGGPAGDNPFLEASLVLTDIRALSASPAARAWAIEAGWDMVIVDEAHHLEEGTESYGMVAELAAVARDVLLLTATPEHHGDRRHFARLRLLDPSRYRDYETFRRESQRHRRVADVTAKLLDGVALQESDFASLREFFRAGERMLESHSRALAQNSEPARRELVAALLDRHGIGRAMFRTTRAAVGGFPPRRVVMKPLEAAGDTTVAIGADGEGDSTVAGDPRVAYVAELLRSLPDEKVLLICGRTERAVAIEEALRRRVGLPTALFHEELSLIQRDRNAAWFADEDGARILVCSEIGSEGRNFQFVHHLVLFDLPADPELVEQRIGRLDRIGQKGPVVIHVPYVTQTAGEVIARWYHEGLGLFARTSPAAGEVFETMGESVVAFAAGPPLRPAERQAELERLIVEARQKTREVNERLRAGRDRLLEQHSFRPHEASRLVTHIRAIDRDEELAGLFGELLRARGVLIEEVTEHTWKLWSQSEVDELFPGLRSSRPMITFDRATALAREDYEFLSVDHPAVTGALELFLGSEKGNAALAFWRSDDDKELLLEAVYIVACVAPPHLDVTRFLPPQPVRVIINHRLVDRTDDWESREEPPLQPLATMPVLDNPDVKQRLLPAMERAAAARAAVAADKAIERAREAVRRTVGGELERLVALRADNPAITEAEIQAARDELAALERAIDGTTPRLDAVRLILKRSKV